LQRDEGLFRPGRVVVAVSGGVDSLTLLHALLHLREELGITLHVATLDHGLRSAAGAADAQFVQATAARWGVPVTAERLDLPLLMRAQGWSNVEASARQVRYAFLGRVAVQVGAATIATGHTLDDQAETLLMHLLRGSGLAGLRGMRPKMPFAALRLALTTPTTERGTSVASMATATASAAGITLVRPLLTTPRTVIEAYARAADLSPRDDATNADLRYLRNRVRHELMPLLERITPSFREALGRLAQTAGDDYDALLATLPMLDERSGLPLAQFRALLPAQQRLLLIQARARLAEEAADATTDPNANVEGQAWDHDLIRRAQQFALTTESAAVHEGWLRIRDGWLYLSRDLPYPAQVPSLPPGSALAIPNVVPSVIAVNAAWRLHLEPPSGAPPAQDDLRVVLMIPAGAALELRTPRRGDRVKLAGMAGKSQKVSDTLVNMKVPLEWRACAPLLTIAGEIAWIIAPQRDGFRSRLAEPFRLHGVLPDSPAARAARIVQVRYERVIKR
jgi:tRNA(Ile)-lysidine synthetase-like protein